MKKKYTDRTDELIDEYVANNKGCIIFLSVFVLLAIGLIIYLIL